VESTEGQGSTFRFVLPLRSAPPREESTLRKRPIQLVGLRLLLAEDNAAIRRVLARLTQSWGLTVVQAGSNQEVLERLTKGETFDLAVLDMQLSAEVDGVALAREIRKFVQAKSLPILLMSSVGTRYECSPG